MRVTHIHIRNVLGIEDLEINPGALTVIRGRNGEGKTSTLEAIKAVLEGGNDATLLRKGAESGEVVLLLDDGVEVRKRITERGSTVTVRHPEFGPIGKPQTYLGRLTDALSVNPVAFLTAPPKKRADWLLEAAPMELDPADVGAILEHVDAEVPEEMLEGHALDVLARIGRRLYDERTGENRTGKEKRTTAAQLAEGLPAEDEVLADSAELRETQRAIRETLTRRIAEIDRAARESVDALREEAQRKIDQIKAEATARAEEIRQEAADATRAEEDAVSEDLDRLTGEIATAEERERQAERIAHARRLVAQMTAEAEAAEARSAALTEALAGLDTLKAGLLANLPFKGLEIRDGDIYHDGVPFDRLNRALQVRVAINVAKLRAGSLGLICVDGLECLDAEAFAAFCAQAAKEDVQLVVTRVAETPLEVQAVA